MNSVVIRQARKEDLPILLEFEQQLIQEERPYDDTLVPETFHYYDLQQMIDSEDSEVLVAENGKTIMASGHARILEAKPYNAFSRFAFLGFMYVVPEFRGRGINQLIIDNLRKWAASKGLSEIRLQVYDDNTRAVKAYEKSGFKKILTEMRLATD